MLHDFLQCDMSQNDGFRNIDEYILKSINLSEEL